METGNGKETYGIGGDACKVLNLDTFTLDLYTSELIDNSTIETKQLRHEIYDNARTTIFEAIAASGHLSEINYIDNLETVNKQILNRLLLGWADSAIEPEKRRRFAEIREELVVQVLGDRIEKNELSDNFMVVTFSDFPDNMTDTQAMNVGYRPSNRKGMVRLHHFYRDNEGRLCRSLEQMSRGGANPNSTKEFMLRYGINLDPTNQSESALLQPMIVSKAEFPDGAVDVQRQLDIYGQTIYGGREASPQHVPYELVRQESRDRERQLDYYAKELEKFDSQLLISRRNQAEIQISRNNKILETLRSICTLAPQYAEGCFGKDATLFYEKASDQFAAGDMSGYQESITRATGYEQTVTFCGGSITTQTQTGLNTPGTIESLIRLTNEAKKNWLWHEGVCRVKKCPTKPRRVKVGPCTVCRSCQLYFDKNMNPSRVYAKLSKKQEAEKSTKTSFVGRILASL